MGDDAGNHHGFKKFSPEKKSMIVSLLMKSGWEVKLAARLKQMKSANKDVGQSSREAALLSLSLVVVGGLLGFVCARVPLLSTCVHLAHVFLFKATRYSCAQ